jgi:hypothetical protein
MASHTCYTHNATSIFRTAPDSSNATHDKKEYPNVPKKWTTFCQKEIQEREEVKANNTAIVKCQRVITSNALALQAQEKETPPSRRRREAPNKCCQRM